MNARSGWVQEFWRIVVLVLVAWAAGTVFNQVYLFLLLALLAYTFRNLFNLQRLAYWLGDPQASQIPIHFGLWGDIYSRIARVMSRHAQRDARMTKLVNEYAASTSALPDATVALEADGTIRWFNDAASRLLGLQAAKDVGQKLVNLFRHPELAAFIAKLDYSRTLELTAPGNKNRRLEVRLAPYGDGQNLLLAQDITDRLQQERVRKDFVANVSHELRTPLTVISGFIENLQDAEYVSRDSIARPLDLMGQQAARMRQIVEDLLLLARLESDSKSNTQATVDMVGLVRLVTDECQGLSPETPEIRTEIGSARRVRGDDKQLRSVVTNLVVNAVNHTPANGEVVVRWLDRGNESVLEVEDSGEGIAAEHIPRLTERFYRVDAGRSRERGGTGLGLAIVKHVLNRHEATLEVESELDKGSRFLCHFPANRLLG